MSHIFPAPGTFIVDLNVTDDTGLWSTDELEVTVVDISDPVADAGRDIRIDQHQEASFNGEDSYDDHAIATWSWTFVHDGEEVTLDGATSTFLFDIAGTYNVTLTVTDGSSNSATDEMRVVVADITPPVAAAGEDRAVDQGATATLDGSSATDNVGVVQWTWTFVYKMGHEAVYGQMATFKFNIPGTYTILLTVEDAAGLTHEDTFELRVMDTHDPSLPGLDDIDTRTGERVTFNGAGATDNMGVASWEWTFEEGGETVTLEGMRVEHVFDEAGDYRVTLTVRDADGNLATETFTVTVSGGAWMWAVVALVVVAAAFGAIILMRRSRG